MFIVLFTIISLFSFSVQCTTLTRVPVSDAKCLDGSPYFYYISQGSTPSRFYVYHEGGGWCTSITECSQRALTDLGSSKNWTSTVNMGDGMSRDASNNPLMYQWTFVYLPYCDGGSFTGDATNTSPLLYFQGLKIRQAVAASLRSAYGFAGATDLVVSGCSAGGMATYLHVDWWASQAATTTKTRALPDSGFFLDGNYARDGIPNYELRINNLYNFMNSKAGIDPTCNAQIGYKCLFAMHAIPFIKSPILALNSIYDATMENGECGHSGIIFDWSNDTSVNLCGNYIRLLFRQLLKPPSAAFLDSCKHHCGEWGAITIEGLKSYSALEEWYNGGSTVLPNNGYIDQNQPYPCTQCCTTR